MNPSNVKPTKDNVLIKRDDWLAQVSPNLKAIGMQVAPGTSMKPNAEIARLVKGTVISTYAGCEDLKAGDTVIYNHYAHDEFEYNGEVYDVVQISGVLALMHT